MSVCCSVHVSVCFVCCVLDSVRELFGETIRNVLGVCSPYVISLCGFAYYVFGKEPAGAMHLNQYVVLDCHQYDVCLLICVSCLLGKVCW